MRTDGNPRISRSENPLMPGSWEPGRFGLFDALTLKVTLIVMALARGFDYLTPKVQGFSPPSPVQESMQTAFPLEIWAGMIMLPALMLAVGLAARIHFAVWLGHGLLAAVYVSLVVSLGLVYFERPWWDGMRSATVLILPAVLHAMISLRTGWRPPRWESTSTQEIEVIEGDG